MQSLVHTENIQKAQLLYNQAKDAEYRYGCLEISLQFFGAHIAFEEIAGLERDAQVLVDAIEEKGFQVNWMLAGSKDDFPQQISGTDIYTLLNNEVAIEGNYPEGEIVGYVLAQYGTGDSGHVIGILPNSSDIPQSYHVMDTLAGGHLLLSAENIAFFINNVLESNGQFAIAQLKVPSVSNQNTVVAA